MNACEPGTVPSSLLRYVQREWAGLSGLTHLVFRLFLPLLNGHPGRCQHEMENVKKRLSVTRPPQLPVSPSTLSLLSQEKRRKFESNDVKHKVQPQENPQKTKTNIKSEQSTPQKRAAKNEEQENLWKWWEEEKKDDRVKWNFLEHKGPMFAPPYEPLPPSVRFYYDGVQMRLSPEAEEVAGFYARMLDHEYTTKEIFNTNFFRDWQKGEKDWKKYETARKLHQYVDKIRADYRTDFKSKEMRIRQRAVALYFIDKLALRAGNEKDEDEADTVGCCSLRCEHVTLHEELDGKPFVVEFDFLGKDSIRYQNSVPVPKRVFKNLKLFMKNKQGSDDLFDRLNTSILNQYLRELMEGLTAKVFRTYNASRTLEEQLELLTNPDDNVAAKLLSYNRANRAVAVLCNHQRAVPKTFAKSMENLQKKIDAKKEQISEVTREAKQIKADWKHSKQASQKVQYEKLKKRLATLKEQLLKLQVQATDRDENKDIALSTSKLNYLDPRITIAWCRKLNVPVEKVYNKTQRDKFQWAIQMTTEDFKFLDVLSDKNKGPPKPEESDEDVEADGDNDY
ncbi:DNA topoisomerase I [Sparganum proliferum]